MEYFFYSLIFKLVGHFHLGGGVMQSEKLMITKCGGSKFNDRPILNAITMKCCYCM